MTFTCWRSWRPAPRGCRARSISAAPRPWAPERIRHRGKPQLHGAAAKIKDLRQPATAQHRILPVTMSTPSAPSPAKPPAAIDQYQRLIDSIEDYAIFMLDADGVICSWNRGAHIINGYSTQDILGKHFSVFYPPELVAQGQPARELKTAAEVGRFEGEGWRVRKDGSR